MITALACADDGGRRNLTTDSRVNELLETFLAGRKATTLRTYQQALGNFATFIHAANIDHAARTLLRRPHGDANHLAHRYRAHLIEEGYAASTINVRLAALRSLVRLARTLGVISWTLEVPGVKTKGYRDTRGPGRDGVRLLLCEAGKRADVKGIRDIAIIRLLHDLGLRRAEVVQLDVEDVDLDAEALFVLGKGRSEKERYTLPAPTAATLKTWLEIRGIEPGPLFVNCDRARKGHRLSGRSIHRIVKALGDQADVAARPHGLRHTAITTALDRTNGNLRAVAKFSRHADVRTLELYDDARLDLAGEVARLVAEELGR